MRTPMDEATFLEFYTNTMLCGSKNLQNFVCKKLEAEHRITFEKQMKLDDTSSTLYFESKRDFKDIITKTTSSKEFMNFYEAFEFKKLYKYSVPFFYETEDGKNIETLLNDKGVAIFQKESYQPEYVIAGSIQEAEPLVLVEEGNVYIKFVLQKMFVQPESYDQIVYRYPILVYINPVLGMLEIRYDSMHYSYSEQIDRETYYNIVVAIIDWIKATLGIKLFCCEHADTIHITNDVQNTEVKMYKQMMEMKSGASAELTASENEDYMLPFIGEIRELIDENEELFNEANDVKQLLLQYLNEKEATANYPYIYIKRIKPVENQSYIVKLTFDYFNGKYTLLQHITGNCKDLGMGRMNDAIEYFSRSSSFVKGEKI